MRSAMLTFGKLTHETFWNADVIKSTNMTTRALLTRPIAVQWMVVLAGFHCIYIYPNDAFWV